MMGSSFVVERGAPRSCDDASAAVSLRAVSLRSDCEAVWSQPVRTTARTTAPRRATIAVHAVRTRETERLRAIRGNVHGICLLGGVNASCRPCRLCRGESMPPVQGRVDEEGTERRVLQAFCRKAPLERGPQRAGKSACITGVSVLQPFCVPK